jgi:CheY-like chemotaxis protein
MSGKKILIVDDEPFFLEVLTARLTSEGYEVVSAKNGEEAIAKARSEKPLLIIMDVMMPQTSGFEAMQKIRQGPETKKIPAIIFSGKAGMKDFFADFPGIEFLHKPFDFKLLMARVGALIGDGSGGAGRTKHAVLVGVEDLVVNKLRDLLTLHHFQTHLALNEDDAVVLSKKFQPGMILCQLWEDEKVLDPRKIARELLLQPGLAAIPFYVYCKEALSLEAMKHFKMGQIITYKETRDLLSKVEILIKPAAS